MKRNAPPRAGKPTKAKVKPADEAGFASEEMITPLLLPHNIANPTLFRNNWSPVGAVNEFKKARELLKNDFFGGVHRVRKMYFNDGFRLTGNAGKPEAKEWARKNGLWAAARRLASDVWREWLAMDNAVAFWTKPKEEGQLPTVCVLDCEMLRYSNEFGDERLEVILKQKKLDDAAKAKLNSRWVEAYTNGKPIVIDPDQGEYFRVLTNAKLGAGLAVPSMVQILQRLSTKELLDLADWCGAYQHKDVIRHIKAGHAITMGDNAGKPVHFLDDKKRKAIEAGTKKKAGAYQIISNFDVDIAFAFLDPKFFDPVKHESTLRALRTWGGPAAMIYETGVPNPQLMQAFGVEGRAHRADVGEFVEAILNDPNYLSGIEPPEEITVGWNPNSFRETKMMLEWLRMATGQGLASSQTAREAMDLDNELEGDRLEAEAKTPLRYRPTFEPKQGMLSGNEQGGRPVEKTET